MRAALALILIAGACFAQVQNAPDVDFGGSTGILAPGARAVVNFFLAGGSEGPSTVSLLPVNSTTQYSAQVLSSTNSAITFVVPQNIPSGPAQLIYKPGGQATQWTTVTIVPASLSLYRTGAVGPLIAPIVPLSGPAYNSGLTMPLQPGYGVELFGSGLGATPQNQVQITLGGVPQQVLYAGPGPQLPGLNQINFLVAPGTPDGCYVPLVLTYGTQSVASFLSKTSDGKPCHHPWGLSQQDLTTLDNGGFIDTVEVELTTGIDAATSNRASRQESAQIVPTSMDAGQVASSFVAAAGNITQPCSLISPVGAFLANSSGGSSPAGQLRTPASAIELPYTSPPVTDSPLSSLPPPVIAAGPYTFSTPGTSFGFTLPPPIQLSGGAPVDINHTQNSTITWNGSGYDVYATLQLTLKSASAQGVACTVPAQAGSVTIPANLLAQFAAGSAGAITASLSENGPGIPSGGGSQLDLAIWSTSDTRPVDFQ